MALKQMTESELLAHYRDAYERVRERAEALEKSNTRLYEREANHTEAYGMICQERDYANARSAKAQQQGAKLEADLSDARTYAYGLMAGADSLRAELAVFRGSLDNAYAALDSKQAALNEAEHRLAEARERIKFLEDGHAQTAVHLVRAGIPAFGWNWEGVDKLAAQNAALREAAGRYVDHMRPYMEDEDCPLCERLVALLGTEPPARRSGP